MQMGQTLSSCKRHIFHNQKIRTVNVLPQQKSNSVISNQQILSNHSGFIGSLQASYFPYNNIFDDKGWGCAWRAIQMVLSGYKDKEGFMDLFHKYSQKQILIQIVKNQQLYSTQVIQELANSEFAPQQAGGNWAEPFICKLICEDKNIKARLFLLNGYPHANAPQSVFMQKLTFHEFVGVVKQNIKSSPVMIDDGLLAMSILAYKQISQNQHSFIIGDPHILSNRQNKSAGIYEIVCDQKGRQIRNSVSSQTLKQAYTKSLQKTYFHDKNWMVLSTCGWKSPK